LLKADPLTPSSTPWFTLGTLSKQYPDVFFDCFVKHLCVENLCDMGRFVYNMTEDDLKRPVWSAVAPLIIDALRDDQYPYAVTELLMLNPHVRAKFVEHNGLEVLASKLQASNDHIKLARRIVNAIEPCADDKHGQAVLDALDALDTLKTN
jgi:hypothetical protein